MVFPAHCLKPFFVDIDPRNLPIARSMRISQVSGAKPGIIQVSLCLLSSSRDVSRRQARCVLVTNFMPIFTLTKSEDSHFTYVNVLVSSVLLTVPVRYAKRAAVASCVLTSSVSCRFPRSTVASAGLHGLGNTLKFTTRGLLSAAVRHPLAGRVRTAPCTSFCVRRRARFEFEGVDTSPTPGVPVASV